MELITHYIEGKVYRRGNCALWGGGVWQAITLTTWPPEWPDRPHWRELWARWPAITKTSAKHLTNGGRK